MDRSNSVDNLYFMLSGVFATFLYILLLLFLVFVLKINQHVKLSINNSSKINSINVSLIDDIEPLLKSPAKDISPQTTTKNETRIKDKGSKTPISGLGASDLFEKIDTKTPEIIKQETPILDDRDKIALNKQDSNDKDLLKNDRLSEVLQKTQNIMNTLQNLNQNITISDLATSKFCDKHTDYCNELSELLYSNWNIKNSFDTKLSSTVVIKVSKDGNFSYTIKKKSGNESFDNDLEESLHKLQNIKFPVLDNIDIDKLEVIFRNKKEE